MSDHPITVTGSAPEVSIDQPRRYHPAATYVILALNLVIYLLMTFAGGSTTQDVLLDFGASYGPYIRRGEYWRLIMPMFLHIGWLHFLLNSYALFVLGPLLERVYGYGRFSLLYVGAGAASSSFSMAFSRAVAAGASGAIMGLAGAMLATGYLHREVVPPRWRRAFSRGILAVILLTFTVGLSLALLAYKFSVPHIDNWGHLGGLLGGMLLARLIPPPALGAVEPTSSQAPSQGVVIIPIAVVALAMAATLKHYPSSRAVSSLLAEGTRRLEAHQPEQALERFQRAARIAPGDERPREELGLLYLEQKHIPEAIGEFEAALRLSADSPRAQLGLALAYEQKGDFAKARQLFEAVLGKNPPTAEGHRALADLCAKQKLYPQAVQHYQEALRLEPNSSEAHNNLAWLYATSEDPKFQNPPEALKHARRAVELTHWKEANSIDTLAEALFANRQFEEAVKVQTKALALDPDNREFQDHMARYRKAAGVGLKRG